MRRGGAKPGNEGSSMLATRAYSRNTIAAGLLAALLAPIGCSREDEPRDSSAASQPASNPWRDLKQGVSQAAGAVKEIVRRTREDFEREFSVELQRLDEKIKELKEKAASATDEAKKRFEEELGNLEKRKEDAKKLMETLKSSGKDALEKMRQKLNESLDSLRKDRGEPPASAPAGG